ncbi:MAG: YncE family protein [bacterium]
MQVLILGILALWGGYSLIPSNEEGLEKQFFLAAGENEEVCLTVHPDQEFKLTFTASEPVYYDIHTHHDEEVTYHRYENATVRSKSEINPNKKDYFCAQWKNHGQSEIEVVYELKVNPANPEGDFLRRNVVFRVDQDSPKTIQVFEENSQNLLKSFDFPSDVLNFALSADEDKLATLLAGEVQLINLQDGLLLKSISVDDFPSILSFSKSSENLLVGNEHEQKIHLINLKNLERTELQIPAPPKSILNDIDSKDVLVRTEAEVLRVSISPFQIVERQARIPLQIGEEVQLVDPYAWCFVHGVPHPLFAPVSPAMSKAGLPGSWLQPTNQDILQASSK